MNLQNSTASVADTTGFRESELPWSALVANHLTGILQENFEELSPSEGKIWLYGLFDGLRCRYVGQTSNPRNRLKSHYFDKNGKIFLHGPLKMKLLRTCPEANAPRLERQIVFAYRRRGQCDLNKSNHFEGAKGLRKFGVKPERTEMQRVRARVHKVIKRTVPRLAFLKRCRLAQEITEEILRYHEDNT